MFLYLFVLIPRWNNRCIGELGALTSDPCALFLRTFINTFIQFRKPIVAAVNGPAVGLGAAILPLCDVVWANEKAWFQTPYTAYGQTPDACSSFSFPRIMGLAAVSQLLPALLNVLHGLPRNSSSLPVLCFRQTSCCSAVGS